MKKYIRLSIALCLCLLCAVMLTSCDALDELKERKVVRIGADENEALLYKENKYVRIDTSRLNNTNVVINFNGDIGLNIVEEDVPLLLTDSGWFSSFASYDKELDMIYTDLGYWCKEDMLEKYENLINNMELDYYMIEYSSYNDDTGRYTTETKILDKKLCDAINDAISGGGSSSIKLDYNNCDMIALNKCDKKGMLMNIGSITLFVRNVAVDTNRIGFVEYRELGEERVHYLSSEYIKMIEDLVGLTYYGRVYETKIDLVDINK